MDGWRNILAHMPCLFMLVGYGHVLYECNVDMLAHMSRSSLVTWEVCMVMLIYKPFMRSILWELYEHVEPWVISEPYPMGGCMWIRPRWHLKTHVWTFPRLFYAVVYGYFNPQTIYETIWRGLWFCRLTYYLHSCSPMGVYGRVSSHTISEPGHNGRVVYVYAGPHTNFEALHVEWYIGIWDYMTFLRLVI